jgi:hypothetical protein
MNLCSFLIYVGFYTIIIIINVNVTIAFLDDFHPEWQSFREVMAPAYYK